MEKTFKESDAIKALMDLSIYDCPDRNAAIAKCIATIKELPSAQNEKLTGEELLGILCIGYSFGKESQGNIGEWVTDDLGRVVCSVCKRPRRDCRIKHLNFCNSCGARMVIK